MEIEIDLARDVAYIPVPTHGPLKRVWRSLRVRDLIVDIDDEGDLVGLELLSARAQLRRLGILIPSPSS